MSIKINDYFNALTAKKISGSKKSLAEDQEINEFSPEESFAFDFIKQKGLKVVHSNEDRNSCNENADEIEELLRATETKLVYLLVKCEEFMRISIRELDAIKSPSKDEISKKALNWVNKAIEIGHDIYYIFYENDSLCRQIIFQRIQLKSSLNEFVKLILVVYSAKIFYEKLGVIYWQWPSMNDTEINECSQVICQELDIIKKLEEIRVLINRQDDSSDRLNRANYRKACLLVDDAFSYCSRLLVVRFDIGYSKEITLSKLNLADRVSNVNARISMEEMSESIKKFTHEFNKIYRRDRLGYLLKIEHGILKGYHAHVFIFLNGHKRQKDVMIARQLGELWANEITEGKGVYWNCNANKNYPQCGIGMIHREQIEKQIILKEKAIHYLMKCDFPFDFAAAKGIRKFRASAIKKRVKKIT